MRASSWVWQASSIDLTMVASQVYTVNHVIQVILYHSALYISSALSLSTSWIPLQSAHTYDDSCKGKKANIGSTDTKRSQQPKWVANMDGKKEKKKGESSMREEGKRRRRRRKIHNWANNSNKCTETGETASRFRSLASFFLLFFVASHLHIDVEETSWL